MGVSPLLVLDGVSVSFGAAQIVRQVSLSLGKAALVALAGPNGAGKTTLLRAMAGLVPASGSMTWNGRSLGDFSLQERARTIGYLAQGHHVHWPLLARDVVALGRYPHGMNDPARMSSQDAVLVEEAIARADAADFADRPWQQLSGGERARIMLARVFVTGAPMILADEPIAALDPRHQLSVMADLKREASRGSLVIVVTHDLGLAARYADVVLLMDGGHLVGQGPPAEVLDDAALARVYGVIPFRGQHQGQPVLLPWNVV
jgi:iron complex transport system ATP-binding protein